MSETREETIEGQNKLVLDEFIESAAKLNDGLSDMITSALRMQILVLEDTQNMMAEFGAAIEATAGRDGNRSDA